MGLVRDDNELCLSEFCQSLPNHTHVKKETSHSCIGNLLSSKSSMHLLNRETQIKKTNRNLYRNVGELNQRSLSDRNKYKLVKPLRVGQKVLLENHIVPFGKSQKLCEHRSGPYKVTKVIKKVNYEIAVDADPTATEVIHRNHLFDYFPRDNELPKLLSNYEKPYNDDKTDHFYNKYAKYRLSQLNQPIDSIVQRQQLNDYLPIFPDTCEPSRKDTDIKLPVKDNGCHSTPNLLASSPDSGNPQSTPHTPLSFQLESTVLTSQPTTPSPLPCTSIINPNTFQSTSTGTTPSSRNAGTLQNIPREWYGEPHL